MNKSSNKLIPLLLTIGVSIFTVIAIYLSLFSMSLSAYTKDELEIAARYFKGELKTTPFLEEFRASVKEDVPVIKDFSVQKRTQLIIRALKSLADNQGVIGILAAGASTRMNLLDAPADVKNLLGNKDIKSKASVPVGLIKNQAISFLGAFLINLARLEEQISKAIDKKIDLKILILSNNDYRAELDEQLREHDYYNLKPEQFVIFHQELGHQMIATPEDALKTSEKLKSSDEDKKAALEISQKAQEEFSKNNLEALMLKDEKAPLGHGEFFHQLISSGTFLKLYEDGRTWISIRNIDNSAATYDENWLVTLGLFLERGLDMQPEVSLRVAGQKGGSLIISGDKQILAEDPQIEASKNKNTTPHKNSHWINNAVAIFSMDYVIDLYKKAGQSKENFIQELKSANTKELEEIAQRGRKNFPVLMDPKPAKTSKAIAMKVETNMWQSTGIVGPQIKIKAVGVDGIFNIKDEFEKSGPEKKAQFVKNLRFLATKQWEGPSESYESNKAYIDFMLEHITQSDLIPKNLVIKH